MYAVDDRSTFWHASLWIVADEAAEGGLLGEWVFDTPSDVRPEFFGRELFDGSYDRSSRLLRLEGYSLEDDQKVGTATYEATLDSNGLVLAEGSWEGPSVIDSDFWVGVRCDLVAASEFDADVEGWSGALRWDDSEQALVVGAASGELVAPTAYHGDWSWRGPAATLLSFQVRWSGEGDPAIGPTVTVRAGAEEARFVVDNPLAFESVTQRTYIIPLRGDLWEREGTAPWQEFLKAIGELKIVPGRVAGAGEFFVDEVKLIRPRKPEPVLLEWDFEDGTLEALGGGGALSPVHVPFSGPFTPWDEELQVVEAEIDGATGQVLGLVETPDPEAPALDQSPWLSLGMDSMKANGNGLRLNCYTLVWDLKVVGEFFTDELFDAGPDSWELEDFRKSTGLILLDARGSFGGTLVSNLGRIDSLESVLESRERRPGDRQIEPGRWHRVVLTVDAAAGELNVYVDGVRVLNDRDLEDDDKPGFDQRFSLSVSGSIEEFPTVFGHLQFLGNEVSLGGLALLDVALPAGQVASLGRASHSGALAPVFSTRLRIDEVALPEIILGFEAQPGFPYRLERSVDLCRWEGFRALKSEGGGRIQDGVTVGPEQKKREFFRVRPALD